MARSMILPGMEQALEKHDVRLRRCTSRVRTEVDTAHMQFVQSQLAAISSVIEHAPTPRYLELPLVRIIPHSRNERFFGRQSILDLMRDCLKSSGPRYQRRFALSGFGGAGKTQIALEYTYRHLDDYKLPDEVKTDPDHQAILKDISYTSHGFPLALAQVAGFIRTGGRPLADFLTMIHDKKNSAAIASLPVSNYHATSLTVWDLSFQSLSNQSRKVLEILVYLDPDSVPYEILERGCVAKSTTEDTNIDLSIMADPVGLRTALQNLRGQSFIRTNPELKTMSIHRLVQEQAFHHLCVEPHRQRRAFEESLFLLSNCQPEFPNVTKHWSPELFRDSEMCLSHIKRLAAVFFKTPGAFKSLENKLGKIIFECASYQFQRFHHKAATETFALARKVIGMGPSPNELILSDCYRMEGRMFNESGQPVQAAESGRQAQKYALEAVSKGFISKDDQRIPRILTGLGNSLSQLEEYDDALSAQLEAKRLCGDVPPEQSDAITIIQLNWGFLMYRCGDLKSAEQILRATLEASPKTPPALYALGNTLLAQGNIEEAIAVHLKGLEIYIESFGDQHALVGRCAYKVGEILLLWKSDPKRA
ncbi:MAG: hypothetical protein Q9173_002454, partial [Seirophora scorigena]